jgi:hypothetical protein
VLQVQHAASNSSRGYRLLLRRSESFYSSLCLRQTVSDHVPASNAGLWRLVLADDRWNGLSILPLGACLVAW